MLDEFRVQTDESGRGYQTMINGALRTQLDKLSKIIDEDTLRKALRVEFENSIE